MPADNPILRFFAWWNGAMADPAALQPEAFGEFFTDDGQLIVNGNVRATGPAALAVHYRAIADRLDLVEMVLPVEAAFATDDHGFVHCRTRAIAAGEESAEEAMAYCVIAGGRMSRLRVVSLSV